MMTDQKREKIFPKSFVRKDLHENPFKILSGTMTILTDEESKNANQANEGLLEGL